MGEIEGEAASDQEKKEDEADLSKHLEPDVGVIEIEFKTSSWNDREGLSGADVFKVRGLEGAAGIEIPIGKFELSALDVTFGSDQVLKACPDLGLISRWSGLERSSDRRDHRLFAHSGFIH